MNLKKCPECHRIIDVDDLEDADLTSIIGCGLKENDFESCYGCENKYGSTI